MAESSLAWLLEPISIKTFFDDYFESKYLLLQDRSPKNYNDILAIGDIDDFFNLERIIPHSILVTKDHQFDIQEWTDFEPGKNMTVNKDKIFAALHKGHSVVLNSLHNYIPKLHRFTELMSNELMCRVNANIYMTPPSGRALKPHIDYHDVIILHLYGKKEWRFYDQPEELPDSSFFINKKNAGLEDPSLTFTMSEGDLLYMPRGIRHDAVTTSSYSIHATIGLHPIRWIDIMKQSLVNFRADSQLRRSFPFQKIKGTLENEHLEEVKKSLNNWVDNLDPNQIYSFARNLLRNEKNKGYSNRFENLLTLDALNGEDYVVSRNPYFDSVKADGIFVVVESLGDKRYTYPIVFKEAIQSVLSGVPIQIKNMAGQMDTSNKLKLVKKLISEGLLKKH